MRTAIIWGAEQKSDRKILVEAEPLQTMDKYRQDRADKAEAGGILLGYRKGPYLHVVQATAPQITDQRSRYRFDRAAHYHQKIAMEQWRGSDSTIDYLGEWHTHPEIKPSPSNIDIGEWSKVIKRQSKPMMFLILGLSGDTWVGMSLGKQLIRCNIIWPR
ncbi:Mov34/MPN/PAD-1 family protein [Pseudomonas guariconensis]|uniref:Mov34/MPN/PAD-1 family protein n=1 Tax=Pseudomonas guariconensis TaxID=1288410 RepID=UPI0018A973E2|nr:Mov34/MPN/PAD-1 family protein [Pseudomonas guariconensis]MBF8742173.1 Mov34/MPN/PAD-1 family protein [Pseudomonas guariconensis]MBF8751279.1 Mov34/MPN/PAD-1 family protein [Pseudomonas guariconensis]